MQSAQSTKRVAMNYGLTAKMKCELWSKLEHETFRPVSKSKPTNRDFSLEKVFYVYWMYFAVLNPFADPEAGFKPALRNP